MASGLRWVSHIPSTPVPDVEGKNSDLEVSGCVSDRCVLQQEIYVYLGCFSLFGTGRVLYFPRILSTDKGVNELSVVPERRTLTTVLSSGGIFCVRRRRTTDKGHRSSYS